MSDPNSGFQPPPPPMQTAAAVEPTISTAESLTGIFFEPSHVFEGLRSRPRFLVAGLILILATVLVTAVLFMRVDIGQFIRDKMDQSPNAAQQTEEQKEMGARIGKLAIGLAGPVFVPISIAAGAGLYLLAVMAFGGSLSYKRSLSVWVYSSLPPSVLGALVAVVVLFLKAPDTVDPEKLLITNPGAFLGQGSSPVLTALLSHFDLLRFYGMFLAAVGLRKLGKLSSGAAWGVVILFWLIGLVLSVASKAAFG
ncbi:MAG: hypothetical protein QOD75_1716 [Blastocatellia bacterium]|nr:hypothetical protein [Blastocatellia bacterium]